jgi:hypothetical protein
VYQRKITPPGAGTVEVTATAVVPVAPVIVTVQPAAAGATDVAVKTPVVEVAGVTVTCAQLDVAPYVPALFACVAVSVTVSVAAVKVRAAGAAPETPTLAALE